MSEYHHLSRWRPICATAHDTGKSIGISLRYLDEFVRKLQCAPQLLEHQLYPDAKEITESMSLFNTVWQCVLRDSQVPTDASSVSGLVDSIIVVGDGNTPRTAAMFAYRLRHWKCYSIDPEMETSSERARKWNESITNLVVIRNKIEEVQIHVRRAVIVLVHAHVTLEQATRAVHAQEILGLVTVPCCNWYGKQEQWSGRLPDVVVDDPSILSDHRELRVWRGMTALSTETLVMMQKHLTGYVLKEFIGDDQHQQTQGTSKKQVRKAVLANQNAHTVLCDVVTERIKSFIVMDEVQRQHLVKSVEMTVTDKTQRVLVFGTLDDELIDLLMKMGLVHLYVVDKAVWLSDQETLELTLSTRNKLIHESIVVTVTTRSSDKTGQPRVVFDYIIDVLGVYTCVRDQPRTSTSLFCRVVEYLMSLLSPLTTSQFLSLSPRKDWNKTIYFSHPSLCLQMVSIKTLPMNIPHDHDSSRPPKALFLYTCIRINRIVSTTIKPHVDPRSRIIELKALVTRDFDTKLSMIKSLLPVTPLEQINMIPIDILVHVHGIIQHYRRYSRSPSFFSIAPVTSLNSEKVCTVQVKVEMDFNGMDTIFKVLHKHQHVQVMGWIDRNVSEHPIIRLHALKWMEHVYQ